MSLLFPSGQWVHENNASLYWQPGFLSALQADNDFAELTENARWQQGQIQMWGKTVSEPRLSAFYGDSGVQYQYSGRPMAAMPWFGTLIAMKPPIETLCQTQFNAAFCNLYRSGQDAMGWHSDDEAELGRNPTIASVSFGAERTFQMKHRRIPGARLSIPLGHGSCLIMQAETQHHWLHQIPKSKKVRSARINLTFRQIYPVDRQASG